MSEIHVYTAEGLQSVHPEERVAELLRSGELPPEALYWRQGMAGWQPLSTFQPVSPSRSFVPARRTEPLPELESRHVRQAKTTSASASRKPGKIRSPNVRFRRYPEPLTTVLQIFLILALGMSGFDLASALVHYNLVSSVVPGLAGSSATALSPITSSTGPLLFYGTLGLTTTLLIPYLMWVYQANINSRHFSSIVRFTRGWAVWCNFIPAINLYMPCQVMQEIWKVSRNPRTWHNDRPSILVGIWWALWLLRVGAYSAWGFLCVRAQTHGDVLPTAALACVILFAIQLVFYGVFFAMITVIVQNQKRLVNEGRRQRTPATAPASTPTS